MNCYTSWNGKKSVLATALTQVYGEQETSRIMNYVYSTDFKTLHGDFKNTIAPNMPVDAESQEPTFEWIKTILPSPKNEVENILREYERILSNPNPLDEEFPNEKLTVDPVTGKEFTGIGLMEQLISEGKTSVPKHMGREFSERRGYSKESVERFFGENELKTLKEKLGALVGIENAQNYISFLYAPKELDLGLGQALFEAKNDGFIQDIQLSVEAKPTVENYRTQEQIELTQRIPNIESYKVNGEVDEALITDPIDLATYKEIYEKYNALITPLLKGTEPKVVSAPALPTLPLKQARKYYEVTADNVNEMRQWIKNNWILPALQTTDTILLPLKNPLSKEALRRDTNGMTAQEYVTMVAEIKAEMKDTFPTNLKFSKDVEAYMNNSPEVLRSSVNPDIVGLGNLKLDPEAVKEQRMKTEVPLVDANNKTIGYLSEFGQDFQLEIAGMALYSTYKVLVQSTAKHSFVFS